MVEGLEATHLIIQEWNEYQWIYYRNRGKCHREWENCVEYVAGQHLFVRFEASGRILVGNHYEASAFVVVAVFVKYAVEMRKLP